MKRFRAFLFVIILVFLATVLFFVENFGDIGREVTQTPKLTTNSNEEKNSTTDNRTTKEEIIKDFIEAEDSRDLDEILTFYSDSPERYWNDLNPSTEQIIEEYKGAWKKYEYTKNAIIDIRRVDRYNYILVTDFLFSKSYGETPKNKRSKVRIIFNEDNKIAQIYGI